MLINVEILEWLCEAVRRKRPELWSNNWILHHDNAPDQEVLFQAVPDPKNQLLKWNTHPLPLIWLQMTSGCFQK
jgi:hypothetical protein